MEFNLNKLRSYGLRYLVRDAYGQMWAHEDVPVRSETHPGYWRIADKFLPPEEPKKRLQHYGYYARNQRRVCVPISQAPIDVRWEDEPYDMVENGLIPLKDLKVWGEPPRF